MEQEQSLDGVHEEIESKDYCQGFNHAYILAGYDEELLNQIEPALNPVNDYFQGFFSGREEYNQEKEQLSLSQLRNSIEERDHNYER
jgi:hypothetical protein